MNGSTENRTPGASEKPGRQEISLKLPVARSMIPLVKRIVDDILNNRKELALLTPEQDRLFRHRRDLSWPERARRYRLQEEVTAIERRIEEALAELASLGVQLIDGEQGRVGFQTIVNGRAAFFSWQPGDEGIDFWHFPEEMTRHAIPTSWSKAPAGKRSTKKA
jgi:hypothetical protein